jgi:hypothetical protein
MAIGFKNAFQGEPAPLTATPAGATRKGRVAPTRMAAGRRAVTRCSPLVTGSTLERMVTVLFSVDDDCLIEQPGDSDRAF